MFIGIDQVVDGPAGMENSSMILVSAMKPDGSQGCFGEFFCKIHGKLPCLNYFTFSCLGIHQVDGDIEIIAEKHHRTIGGINSRRQEIAYKMYLRKISIEEIINQTKLDYNSIEQTIQKRQPKNSKKIKTKEVDNIFISINKNDYIELENDVKSMKSDIYQIKNVVKELVEMMKAVYEFEDT